MTLLLQINDIKPPPPPQLVGNYYRQEVKGHSFQTQPIGPWQHPDSRTNCEKKETLRTQEKLNMNGYKMILRTIVDSF